MYSADRSPAYWGPIGQVRKNIGIPVIANGDIWTLDDFKQCRDETQCEHFMLGRGVMADPLLPQKIARECGIRNEMSAVTMNSREAWAPWLRRFLSWSEEFEPRKPTYLLARMKQWLHFAHSRNLIDWFDEIKRCQTLEEFKLGIGI